MHVCPTLEKNLTLSNRLAVQDIYLQCIEYGIDYHANDPMLSACKLEFLRKLSALQQAVTSCSRQKKNVRLTITNPSLFNNKPYSQQRRLEAIYKFERVMLHMKWETCPECRMSGINLLGGASTRRRKCSRCLSYRLQHERDFVEKNLLPLWKGQDDENHYTLPDELRNLTNDEKTCIAKNHAVMKFVTSREQLGRRSFIGHTITFRKENFHSFVNDLITTEQQRLYVRRIHDGKEYKYRIRRKETLDALLWLSAHHEEYTKDAEFVAAITKHQRTLPNNATLQCNEIEESLHVETDTFSSVILPSIEQAKPHTRRDKFIAKEIRQSALSKRSYLSDIDYPIVCNDPIDIYDAENKMKLMSSTFPHLYPGGFGDIYDYGRGSEEIRKNFERLLRYEDGRFMKDLNWISYAMNLLARINSSKSGSWFYREFLGKEKPVSLEKLKEEIQNGNTSFISKILYFSSTKIRGCDAYWRSKKRELQNWIDHHVQQGHGAPTLFITLSCAENYFPDLYDIIYDILKVHNPEEAEKVRLGDFNARCNAMDDYIVVVQGENDNFNASHDSYHY